MSNGFTSITAENIIDLSGYPLSSGRVGWLPVNDKGEPISVSATGPIISRELFFLVANGKITAQPSGHPAQVADTLHTRPQHAGYRVRILDSSGNELQGPGYECVQPSGDTWSLDDFYPNQAALTSIQTGPPGPRGADGFASPVALAKLVSKLPVAGNYFDFSAVTPAHFVEGGSGNILYALGYVASDYMPANAGGQMVCSVDIPADLNSGLAFYDQNGVYVSGQYSPAIPAGTPFNVPAQAAFVRVTMRYTDPPAAMVVFGATLPSAYESYGTYPKNIIDAKLLANVDATAQATTNLLDLNELSVGAIDLATGQPNGNAGFRSSGFVPVVAGDHFVSNTILAGGDGFGTAFFDANKALLPGSNYNGVLYSNVAYVVPAGAHYLRAYIVTTALPGAPAQDPAQWMIVQGDYCSTVYYPFRPSSDSSPRPGSGYDLSDATTGSQAASLAQVRSLIAASRSGPKNYRHPRAGTAFSAYGDSITYGVGQTVPGWPAMVATQLGATLSNMGVVGDQAADTASLIFNSTEPDYASNVCYSLAVGTNDARTDASLAVYTLCHQAAIAWLGTCAIDRLRGSTASASGWANDTHYNITGKTTSTSGASITWTLQNYGKALYVWYRIGAGQGSFVVAVDGAQVATVTAGVAVSTVNAGSTSSVALLRIPGVSAGSHAVQITSQSSSPVSIVAVGTPGQHAYYSAPSVCVASVPPQQLDNQGALSAAFTLAAIDNVELLQSDGLDVRFVDIRSVLDDGAPELYADALHPNDAGKRRLVPAYVDALQRTPSASVNRGTPVAAVPTRQGTPGESWAANGFVYGVQANGALQRTATTPF